MNQNKYSHILLVDDDEELRSSISDQLEIYDEFTTEQSGTASEALGRIRSNHYDALILDVGLPDIDGRELCRLARQAGIGAPIIMLTAMDSDADTVLGLDAGANDYITKPFRLNVLVARLRAQLRQHEQSVDAVFSIGAYSFRPATKLLVTQEGQNKIRLTEKEAQILRHLYRAGGKPIDRETLLAEIWAYKPEVTTHTLETHIYRLRQKIETNPEQPRIIVTEGDGYCLLC
ncbi:response regulator transcription factor [Fodinicurvata sediminis]|uniref:response regulator transcription factor n=1 Tax=Fodinicurvata sediminis TaxID=1121832 RepID=UPI00047CDE28|nr:response regulator transcription factor [Fodinicurvata sediminis]